MILAVPMLRGLTTSSQPASLSVTPPVTTSADPSLRTVLPPPPVPVVAPAPVTLPGAFEQMPNPTSLTPAATQVVPVTIAVTTPAPGYTSEPPDVRPFYKKPKFWLIFAGGVAAGVGVKHLWSNR